MASVVVSHENNIAFSDYYSNLKDPARVRYREKVFMCGFDPYMIKKSDFTEDKVNFPNIQYPDIVNYLVLGTSWATGSQMKAYKSLDAYNFFVSGWVNNVLTKPVNGTERVVVTARVNHSQRARETPLKPWFLAEMNGEVDTAHCDCMAGLCEACSHVGALLFAVQAGVQLRDSTTCTQEKGRWIMPTYIKEVPYLSMSDMDLSSASKRQKEVSHPKSKQPTTCKQPMVEETSTLEQTQFFKDISSFGKSAVLSLIPPHNTKFKPYPGIQGIPKSIPEQLDEKYSTVTLNESLEKIDEVFESLTINENEARTVESCTRDQSSSKLWYNQRSGRVTASKFKSVCHAKQDNISKGLVNSVCYPEALKFSTEATRWGQDNEDKAIEAYTFSIVEDHQNLSVSDCGLHINSKWPYFGATPDGIVICECCGVGLCEVKCPYKHRNDTIFDAALTDKNFCVQNDDNGLYLNSSHDYYYQVQYQLFITEAAYCDFVVWTQKDLFIQRVLPNEDFWEPNVTKAITFYKKGVLPELLKQCCKS